MVEIDHLLSTLLLPYNDETGAAINKIRIFIKELIPGTTEQVDITARMIAYCFGKKYTEMICTILPSKQGIKISFFRGVDLPDPTSLLKGTARTTRYLSFNPSKDEIPFEDIRHFLRLAHQLYLQRMKQS